MAEPAGQLGLSREPLAKIVAVRQLRREDLDGRVALQPRVHGPEYHSHPAAADFRSELILIAQRPGKPVSDFVGHVARMDRGRCLGNSPFVLPTAFPSFRPSVLPSFRPSVLPS